MDLKQFEGMNVATARKNKEQEEDALDLKNKRNPKSTKEKTLKEVPVVQPLQIPTERAGKGNCYEGVGCSLSRLCLITHL